MLKPAQAAERLAEFKLSNDANRLAADVKKLPARLQEIASGLWTLEDDPSTRHYLEQVKRQAQTEKDLLSLSAKDRLRLFSAVSPKLAPHLEAAWTLLGSAPYQVAWSRKAFRAPDQPQATIARRRAFLSEIGELVARYRIEVLTPVWVATWAAHLSQHQSGEIGVLLAAVLNEQTKATDEVFEILRQSMNGEHEIGAMGRHVIRALLLQNREEGWELIEKLLLAAQRQEGLRQSILESVDECHPEAFRRMLRVILDRDLLRFAATVRAVDVWFGHLWAAASAGVMKGMLGQVLEFLESPKARDKALAGKDAQAAYLALWCIAVDDAVASVKPAQKLLSSRAVEMRYIAARHLANLGLDVASDALEAALADDDLRVAFLGLAPARHSTDDEKPRGAKKDSRFEKIERLLERTPAKPKKLDPLVWPWTGIQVEQSQVAQWLQPALGERPATRLIPHLDKMDPRHRRFALEEIVKAKPWSGPTRQAVLELIGDAAADVRAAALTALEGDTLRPDEAVQLESYLRRKTGDLRRGVLKLLYKQTDEQALASGARLLASKDGAARLAGLELLRLLADDDRCAEACRAQTSEYAQSRKKLTKEEQSHLDEIAKEKHAVATLDDALGLMNPADRTPVVAPRNLRTTFVTPAAEACLKALDDLVHQHRETVVEFNDYQGAVQRELLGNMRWGFPQPDFKEKREGQATRVPLIDVWREWFENRGAGLKDADGLELVRASVWHGLCDSWAADRWKRWAKGNADREKAAKIISGGRQPFELRYPQVVDKVLDWLLFLEPVDARDFLLDATETSYSLVPEADMQRLAPGQPPLQRGGYAWMDDSDNLDWRDVTAFKLWSEALDSHLRISGLTLSTEQRLRCWRLSHWRDEPFHGAARQRPDVDEVMEAFLLGGASLADLADHLLGPRGSGQYSEEGFDLLEALTERVTTNENVVKLAENPQARDLVERAVSRIFELELARGDAPTAATQPSYSVRLIWYASNLLRVLQSLGKAEFKIGAMWRSGGDDRRQSLTHLARVTHPAPDESQDEFVKMMREAVKKGDFPEDRLLQLAFLAPQWTKFIEAYFGWPHLDEALFWFLAHMHTWGGDAIAAAALAGGVEDEQAAPSGESEGEAVASDDDGSDDADDADRPLPTSQQKKLSPWERLLVERTPLTAEERQQGAVDVVWFHRTHALLGPSKWEQIASAARFAATPAQAKRARFIGEVLLGNVKRQELVDGIKKKQLKENVRLLGLLPLASGKKRDADLAERCRVLRDYRRYANSLSGLTKPDALRAWEIGMRNLAQTAGFADPMRLEWAVGAEAVSDLAKGPVSVTQAGVTVTLALDDQARPSIVARRGDKELKSTPPAVKKEKKVAALLERFTDIRRQSSSVRSSLESAACRGDVFSGDELRSWCEHTLLAPLIARLVVVGEGIMGYPDKQGKALRDCRGKLEPVKPSERLRFAHPHDLLASGQWHEYQRDCFQAERIQPFKQVFRELYVPTAQEKKAAVSHRYDGQQVQPQQALALFGSRGWNTGEGVFKVFHEEGFSAEVHFSNLAGTPGEVEGWTLAGVAFRLKNEWKQLKLTAVPPRLFSEVMRDVDLVVSVAHAGGVAPEASESTVEMRASLVRETCELLDLGNVRFKSSHVLIDGELANYSVHLGSGTVHRLPGGAVCIVPVHAQQRGRIFLPFADDDPRTAEIVAKTLMLAKDGEIQDPSILEQLRR